MLFSPTFSKELRENGRKFTLQHILSVPKRILGVYVLYFKHTFIYVGKAAYYGSGMRERLTKHYGESHNEELSLWIAALDGKIRFTLIPCDGPQISDLEKSLIHYLQPKTNVERYPSYTPHPTQWRQAHA